MLIYKLYKLVFITFKRIFKTISGQVCLYGSCVYDHEENKTYLILGEPYTGKSKLIINLIEKNKYTLISEDIVVMNPKNFKIKGFSNIFLICKDKVNNKCKEIPFTKIFIYFIPIKYWFKLCNKSFTIDEIISMDESKNIKTTTYIERFIFKLKYLEILMPKVKINNKKTIKHLNNILISS